MRMREGTVYTTIKEKGFIFSSFEQGRERQILGVDGVDIKPRGTFVESCVINVIHVMVEFKPVHHVSFLKLVLFSSILPILCKKLPRYLF
jgi:hypothetical protein